MKHQTSLVLAVLLAGAAGCATNQPQSDGTVEKGRDGTVAYYIEVESSEPGVRIEADGEYVGKTPCRVRVWGDKDGTFHNFGNDFDYVIKAYPSRPGQYVQTKAYKTGGWFTEEHTIPKRVYFDMNLDPLGLGAR